MKLPYEKFFYILVPFNNKVEVHTYDHGNYLPFLTKRSIFMYNSKITTTITQNTVVDKK